MSTALALLPLLVACAAASTDVAPSSPCAGERSSTDAIVILGQKRHSSYDATHSTSLLPTLLGLQKFYSAAPAADILVWHEGDLSDDDVGSVNLSIRLCKLKETAAWGKPPWVKGDPPNYSEGFALGYLYMIRWYAVTVWQTLWDLGYTWMMRLDDDSTFESAIPYNLFDYMRTHGYDYGFRGYAAECGRSPNDKSLRRFGSFGHFVDGYVFREGLAVQSGVPLTPFCESAGTVGFYNNFYISSLAFWLSPNVSAFIHAFDRNMGIFYRRDNDLIFHTAAIRLFLPAARRKHFVDWSYRHHTIRNGMVWYGGLEVGHADADADGVIERYLDTFYRKGGQGYEIRRCPVRSSAAPGDVWNETIVRPPSNPAPWCAPLELW